ncbi:serine/threonine protein phosphatase [Lysinibacillus telephonicus]|uniref:Serine/threonine protein phosphatase n=1 Tax=Lysinibacillus telephonicus TaxID=1714840 RepID=A0A431URH2_9BACI|nr:serine/threonine protein phosphatase [Lysinibacillus telephonicus]RTQ92871.1 serine/threonine protein phosphatase [Lysinibacillus telephonicus]
MRKENSKFETAFLSEAGSSIQNKDYFAFVELDDFACWVMADGLDTDQEIESAELVVKSIIGQFLEKPTMSRRKLKNYMRKAHKQLQIESKRFRLKASVTVVVSNYSKIVWAVAGHTRLYVYRNDVLHLRSDDLSLAQTFANEEKISLDRIDTHDERYNLLTYMGMPNKFNPFVSKKMRLNDGDILLLCTAGLWENVESTEMLDAVTEEKDGQKLVDTLEEIVLSKQKQRIPNYTAAAIMVNKVFQEDPKKRTKIFKRIALALIPILLLGGIGTFFIVKDIKQKAEWAADMVEYSNNGDTYVEDGDYAAASKEYSEAKNAAKRIKDIVHRELYAKKQRITHLIAQGDTMLGEGDYVKAIEFYEKAKKESKALEQFSKEDLDKKIEQASAVQGVLDAMKDAELKLAAKDYVAALAIFEEAKKEAIEVSYTSGQELIQEKMTEAETKIAEIERELRILDAEKLEKSGDQNEKMNNLAEAMTDFAGAQEIYQEIDMLEKVLAMERKITKIQELMQSELSEQQQETKVSDADRLEQKGDKFLASQNYGQAIASFSMAQQLYQDANQIDKAMAVSEKKALAEQEQTLQQASKEG